MTTIPTIETTRTCTLCGNDESATTRLLVAGSAPICRDCDQRFRGVFRAHLEPIADSARSPLDQLMSTVSYVTEAGHWAVHLHTFRPGLVIGKGGATVNSLRDALVQLTGDAELRLNLVEHSGGGCTSRAEAAAP
ncbi:MAG TPA: KH domain-containing protein [Acidimicrobiales bacterium]|nr:KH domain-containing protein [Acidimicrobiales bacterium]